jgi:hypothetical protein
MELYPERVYSRPEFTALPPYLFSGADFALIPSRDEPFGLVAVAMGNMFSGTVYPMGRRIRALSWNIPVALAGSAGRDPRSGTRRDLSADTIPAARVCNSSIRTIDRLHLRDGGESDGAEQDRTRLRIP